MKSEEIQTADDLAKKQQEKLMTEVADQVNARQIEVELGRGYRIYDSPNYGKLRIYLPSIDTEYQADVVYSEEVLNLMRNTSLPTTEQLFEDLHKDGTWGDDQIQKHEKLREETFDLTSEYALARADLIKNPTSRKLKNKVNKLMLEVEDVRNKYLAMEGVRQKYLSLTVEGKAREKQLIYKLVECVKYDGTDEPVWASMKELEEGHSNRVRDIVIEFTTFSNGVSPQVLDLVPNLEIG